MELKELLEAREVKDLFQLTNRNHIPHPMNLSPHKEIVRGKQPLGNAGIQNLADQEKTVFTTMR